MRRWRRARTWSGAGLRLTEGGWVTDDRRRSSILTSDLTSQKCRTRMSGARTFHADAQRQFNNLSAGYQPAPSFLAKEMLLNRRDQDMGSRRSPAGRALDGG